MPTTFEYAYIFLIYSDFVHNNGTATKDNVTNCEFTLYICLQSSH